MILTQEGEVHCCYHQHSSGISTWNFQKLESRNKGEIEIATSISCGLFECIVLTDKHNIHHWSQNKYLRPDYYFPPKGTIPTQVAAGNNHFVALASTGTVYT
jgi:hypothetical protein